MGNALVKRLGQRGLDSLVSITARWHPSAPLDIDRVPRTLTVLEDMLATLPPTLPKEQEDLFARLPTLVALLEQIVLDDFINETVRQQGRCLLVMMVEAAARWALLHRGFVDPTDLFDKKRGFQYVVAKLVKMKVVDIRPVAVHANSPLGSKDQPRTAPEEVWHVVHSARNLVHKAPIHDQRQAEAAALFLLLLVDCRRDELAKALRTNFDHQRETGGRLGIAVPLNAAVEWSAGKVVVVPLARERELTKHVNLPEQFVVIYPVPGSDIVAAARDALQHAAGLVVHGLAMEGIGNEQQLQRLAVEFDKPVLLLVEPPRYAAPTWPAPGRCGDEAVDLGSYPGLNRTLAEYLVETASPTELLRALLGAESELGLAGVPPRTWVSVNATELTNLGLQAAALGPAVAWHRRFGHWEDVDVLVLVDDLTQLDFARKVSKIGERRWIFASPHFGRQDTTVLRHAAIAIEQGDLADLGPALVSWCDLVLQLAPEASETLGEGSRILDAYAKARDKSSPDVADLKRRILGGEAVQIRRLLGQDYGQELLVWLAKAVPAWLPTLGAVAATVKNGVLAGEFLYLAATAKEPYRSVAIDALVARWTAGPEVLIERVNDAVDRAVGLQGESIDLRAAVAAILVRKNMAADQTERFVKSLSVGLSLRDKNALGDLANGRSLSFSNAHADLLERLAGRDPGVDKLDEWLRSEGTLVSTNSEPWWRIVRSSSPDADRLAVLWRTGADASPLGLHLLRGE